MKKIKGIIKAIPIAKAKIGYSFVWFKDNKWCVGVITGEGCEGKTRVEVDGSPYETHTHLLSSLAFIDRDDDFVCYAYTEDFKELIKLEVINTSKEIELVFGTEKYCSYPGSCECVGEDIDDCLLSYGKPVVSLNKIEQEEPKKRKTYSILNIN